MNPEYVMYKGEDLLHIGTKDELSKLHGVKRSTIHFYTTQAYKNKIARRKNARNYITLTKIEEDEDND